MVAQADPSPRQRETRVAFGPAPTRSLAADDRNRSAPTTSCPWASSIAPGERQHPRLRGRQPYERARGLDRRLSAPAAGARATTPRRRAASSAKRASSTSCARGMSAAREDSLLGGAVRLLQPARGHRAGTDAVLLAAAAPASAGDVVTGCGAGTGAVGLTIAARLAVRLILVEREPRRSPTSAARNIAAQRPRGPRRRSRPPRPPFLGGGGPCGRRGRSRRHQSALFGSGQGTAVARSGAAPPRMPCRAGGHEVWLHTVRRPAAAGGRLAAGPSG